MLRRVPTRADGKETRQKIISSAYELFSKNSYNDVSISKIAKNAGISVGAFYQYFKNKESLFRYIVNKIFEKINKAIKSGTKESIVKQFINFAEENPELISVLHEAEFIHTWVDEKFEEILFDLSKEFVKNKQEFIYFWGPVRFSVIYHVIWKNEKIDFEDLIKFIKHGFGNKSHDFSPDVFDFRYQPVNIDIDTTKMKLLIAAEELFGKNGYSKTKISDITNSISVAQGTFYLYFSTKKDILVELVERTNKNLRLSVKLAVQKFNNRLDAELAGFYAFLKFFSHHLNMYRIVRESEFIDKSIALGYYEKIKNSYITPLKEAMNKKEILDYNAEELAVFLMGLGHFLGKELLMKDKVNEADIIRFLMKFSRYLKGGLEG